MAISCNKMIIIRYDIYFAMLASLLSLNCWHFSCFTPFEMPSLSIQQWNLGTIWKPDPLVFLVFFFFFHLRFLPARNKIQWNQNDLKQKSKATEFIDPFSHITSDVICYVHTTNKLEKNTWSVTQVNKHLAYEVLPCCLYYVDKITSVRRKKYKVQSTSGKFSHLDIWKICMFNLHWHQFHFIKMKFYRKIWKEKKHEGCVFRGCISISAWASVGLWVLCVLRCNN